MLDFVISYWKLILLVLLLVANLIISICKRPKVLETVIDCINNYVPTAINEAERFYGSGNGSAKLKYAVNNVLDYLSYRFNYDRNYLKTYEKLITIAIENVLSTPQKKGENNG